LTQQVLALKKWMPAAAELTPLSMERFSTPDITTGVALDHHAPGL